MGQSKTTIATKLLSPSHPSSPTTSSSSSTSSTPRQGQQLHTPPTPAPPSLAQLVAGSYISTAHPPPTLAMGDQQQYITHNLHNPDGLSGNHNLPEVSRSSAAPPASAYNSVLTPYSAVSSFNYPAQCDSSLLTPISSAGSPPLHQGQKLGRQYPPLPSTPHQAHTPPENPKMFNSWSQYDSQAATSQTSSPMLTAAPVAPEFGMPSYMTEDRRTPGPPEPYLGSFSVSTGAEQHSIEQPYYVMQSMDHPHGLMMRDASQPMQDPQGRPLASTPLLAQPHPADFRQPRRPSMDEHNIFHHADPSRSLSGSPRRRAVQGNARVKKRAPRRPSGPNKNQSPPEDPAAEHKNCHGEEVIPRMKSTCSEIDRKVVELRWKYRNKRGQDMWQAIQKEIEDWSNGKTFGREDLQMKFRRSRLHIDWENEDERLLKEAWIAVEAERYQTIHKKFIELGGSRNMCLNAVDIEAKIAALKMEEQMYIQGPRYQIRRRRKVPSRKRNAPPTHDDMDMLMVDDRMSPPHNLTQEQLVMQIRSARDQQWAQTGDLNNDTVEKGLVMGSHPSIKLEPGTEHLPSHMRH